MKILVIEDDSSTAAYIGRGLKEQGHVVDHAATGRDGLFLAGGEHYDVIVVDRVLPGCDGIGLVRTLRTTGIKTPVLFLTTLGRIDDRVEGLEAGGDDYLVKPFAFSELLARLAALTRRPPLGEAAPVLCVGDLVMDLKARSVTRRGETIALQPKEFQLLEYLLRNVGRVVTRTMLLEHVWDFHFDPRTNIVETHVTRLRAKIERGHGERLIETLRGIGYVIRAPS
ncbi:MAG: response regulator transcription factor [Rhodospirillales bacterium]|nr:response regulator transcription factor [Rhodospirillales bacterium]